MNSEHRHGLQQNVLANYFGAVLKKIEPYTKLIAAIFAAVVVSLVALAIVLNNKTMATSDATLELLQNANGGDAEALATVSDRYNDTVAGTMARLYEADTNLSDGITALFTDREEARSKIDNAIKAYKSVIASAKDKLLVSRGNFGLGRAYESIGNSKDAVAAYKSAIATSESDAVKEASEQRIALLEKTETQEFLTWFAKQDFKPADPTTPPSFPDQNSLPDLPDLDLPDLDLPPVTTMRVPDELKSATVTSGDAEDAPGAMTMPAEPAKTEAEPAKTETEPAKTEEPPVAKAVEEVKLDTPVLKVEESSAVEAKSEATKSAKAFVGDNASVRVTDEKQ